MTPARAAPPDGPAGVAEGAAPVRERAPGAAPRSARVPEDVLRRRSRRVTGAIVLAGLAAIAGCAGARPGDTAGPARGTPAPIPGAPTRALFAPIPEAEAAAVKNVHRFRGASLCQACHAASGALAAEPVALCVRCHAQEHGNHPVGVAQSQPVKDLPLAGGAVVCHTCHDPHSEMVVERGLRLEFNALCQRCHPGH